MRIGYPPSRLAFLSSLGSASNLPTPFKSSSPLCSSRPAVTMAAKRKTPPPRPESPQQSAPPATRPRLGPPTELPPAPPPPPGVLKVMSYNVCSLRSMLKTDTLQTLFDVYRPDLLLLQETKMTPEAVAALQKDVEEAEGEEEGEKEEIPGLPYDVYWAHSTTAKGRHGVATLVRRGSGLEVRALDAPEDEVVRGEGRVVALSVSCERYGSFAVVNSYVPNSGAKLARLEYRCEVFEDVMRNYLRELRGEYGDVLLTGDLNVAHEEIDIHDSKRNSKNAGHTPEERKAFTELIAGGMVDAFRAKYADLEGAFTFWSKRSPTTRPQNKGWRLDYAVVNREFFPRVADVVHLSHVDTSDHCPVLLSLAPLDPA